MQDVIEKRPFVEKSSRYEQSVLKIELKSNKQTVIYVKRYKNVFVSSKLRALIINKRPVNNSIIIACYNPITTFY